MKQRRTFTETIKAGDIVKKIEAAENERLVAKGTSGTLEEFFNADDNSQRAVFDEPSVSIYNLIFLSCLNLFRDLNV